MLWALAAVVVVVRPTRDQNRILAATLVFQGATIALLFGFQHLFDRVGAEVVLRASFVCLIGGYSTYLLFVGTLPSRFARPLRTRAGRAAVAAYAGAELALFAWRPEWFIGSLEPAPGLGSGWLPALGPLTAWVGGAALLIQAYGMLVAIDAWRHADGEMARRQARTYFLAFIGYDLVAGAWILHFLTGQPGIAPEWHGVATFVPVPVATIWLAVGLTYGILKHQLFDIDLRIKAALRRSVVGAVFAALFVVSSELLERAVPAAGLVAGLLVAVAIAAGMSQVERLAQRIVNRLLPGVSRDARYLERRKEEVYAAAVEGAIADGVVTHRERDILERLRRELGLSEADAHRVELAAGVVARSDGPDGPDSPAAEVVAAR